MKSCEVGDLSILEVSLIVIGEQLNMRAGESKGQECLGFLG